MSFSLQIFIKRVFAKLPLFDYTLKVIYVNLSKIKYKHKYEQHLVVENSFLLECFKGKMVNDSPLAIYQELLNSGAYSKCTWVLSSPTHPMFPLLQQNKNTSVVIYGSDEYFQAYATHKYWIVNCRIPFRIVKKANQVFVQCWHGTPLKKIGLDIVGDNNALVSQLGSRYLYQVESKMINHFISPSHYASTCFSSSFGVKKEKILELGYPRNDQLVKYKNNTTYINNIKKLLNIPLSSKVVLYAPTYRDNSFCNKQKSHVLNNSLDSVEFMSNFNANVVFLYRGHYFACKNKTSSLFIDVSSHDDVNDILLISDLLVTDYSSLFFDYSILNMPTLFYMFDREVYENKTRGFYLDIDSCLPGRISSLPSTLASDILQKLNTSPNLQAFNSLYNSHEDGFSSQRVINAIIN